MYVVYTTHDSLLKKQGLPLFNQIISWITLGKRAVKSDELMLLYQVISSNCPFTSVLLLLKEIILLNENNNNQL